MAEPQDRLLTNEDAEANFESVVGQEQTPSSPSLIPTEFARGRRLESQYGPSLFLATGGVLFVAMVGTGWLYMPRAALPPVASIFGASRAAVSPEVAYRSILSEELKQGDKMAVHRGMLNLDEAEVNPCYIKKRAYNPIDMLGAIPLAAAVAEECQDRCADKKGCKFFSFDHISKVCHLADSSATLGPVPVPFISGPAMCSSESNTTITSTSSTANTSTSLSTRRSTTLRSTTTGAPNTTTPQPSASSSVRSSGATTQPLPPPSSKLPQYEPTKAPADHLPSMYCFEMAMPTGYEPGLVRAQVAKRASIFNCHLYDVFSTDVWDYGNGQLTTKISAQVSQKGSWGSWLNTANFLAVWDTILVQGKFRTCDWTAKADPDAVFMPDRLQLHLQKVFPQGTNEGIYIKNCPKSFGLMGVLEVFSRAAVDAYGVHRGECRGKFHPETSGEDGYMQACMEYSGVRAQEDFQLLIDGFCGEGSCYDNHWNVAFHPYKDVQGWFNCWDQVVAAR